MHNHIITLIEETKNINMTYSAAYTQDGNPDIGVRKENCDAVVIGDICWLVSGDIYNKNTREKITNIKHLSWFRPNGIYVDLRAQAAIAGKIVQVHLGKRDVSCMTRVGDGGTLVLVPEKN